MALEPRLTLAPTPQEADGRTPAAVGAPPPPPLSAPNPFAAGSLRC